MKECQVPQESRLFHDDYPRITVITATYNAVKELPWTLKSIREQTYPNVEWIIADGGSTDGTLDLIQSNSDIINAWFSDKDFGIYDAWNKALKYASGTWIQFIGAGDELGSPDVYCLIANELRNAHPEFDIVYGNIQYISESSRALLEEVKRPWIEIKGKWETFRPKLPVHPEVFHHKSILSDDQPFSLKYKIAADSLLLLKNLLHKDPKYIDILIDKMPVGGVSWGFANPKLRKELLSINAELGIRPPRLYFYKEYVKFSAKMAILKLLKRNAASKLADYYRSFRGLGKRWTIK